MFDIVDKHWPMSEGDGKAARKKKPRILAITTDCCTGCAGSPACIEYCPIEACMFWVPDEDHPPFGRIEVDPYLCIGCQKCISKGPDGAFLDGCPWDAIEMIPKRCTELLCRTLHLRHQRSPRTRLRYRAIDDCSDSSPDSR